jgi:hypothetical protein
MFSKFKERFLDFVLLFLKIPVLMRNLHHFEGTIKDVVVKLCSGD